MKLHFLPQINEKDKNEVYIISLLQGKIICFKIWKHLLAAPNDPSVFIFFIAWFIQTPQIVLFRQDLFLFKRMQGSLLLETGKRPVKLLWFVFMSIQMRTDKQIGAVVSFLRLVVSLSAIPWWLQILGPSSVFWFSEACRHSVKMCTREAEWQMLGGGGGTTPGRRMRDPVCCSRLSQDGWVLRAS